MPPKPTSRGRGRGANPTEHAPTEPSRGRGGATSTERAPIEPTHARRRSGGGLTPAEHAPTKPTEEYNYDFSAEDVFEQGRGLRPVVPTERIRTHSKF